MREIVWRCPINPEHLMTFPYGTTDHICPECKVIAKQELIIFHCDECKNKAERRAGNWYEISLSVKQYNQSGGAYRPLDSATVVIGAGDIKRPASALVYNVTFCSIECLKAWGAELVAKDFIHSKRGDSL